MQWSILFSLANCNHLWIPALTSLHFRFTAIFQKWKQTNGNYEPADVWCPRYLIMSVCVELSFFFRCKMKQKSQFLPNTEETVRNLAYTELSWSWVSERKHLTYNFLYFEVTQPCIVILAISCDLLVHKSSWIFNLNLQGCKTEFFLSFTGQDKVWKGGLVMIEKFN